MRDKRPEERASRGNGCRTTSPTSRGFSLLLVEDDEQIRGSLREWLESVFLAACVRGASSDEVLTLDAPEAPDVIVVDVTRPIGRGSDVIRQLSRAFPEARIVALDNEGDPQCRQAVLEAGADTCVPTWQVHKTLPHTLPLLLEGPGEPGSESIHARPNS